MNVRQLFHCTGSPPDMLSGASKLADPNVYIGVEIEAESTSPLPSGLDYWKFEEEGSLKSDYGAEYVFNAPLKGASVDAALNELESELKCTGACFPSNTSVHVHIDVSNLSVEELRAFAYLSIVLEDALIRLSGNRWGNNFCLPYRSNPYALKWLGNTITNGSLTFDHSAKYAAVNFEPIKSYGTVEFRSHVGTYSAKEITDWLNVLLNVRRFAVEMAKKGPADAVLSYVLSGKQLPDFLRAIWPEDVVRRAMDKDLHSNMCKASIAAQLGLYPKKSQDFHAWARETAGVTADRREIKPQHTLNQPYSPHQLQAYVAAAAASAQLFNNLSSTDVSHDFQF